MEFFAAHEGMSAWLILIGLAVFPRITLLFVGGPFAWFHWVGWVFAPHLLVAVMASFRYWDSNPWLVVVAWVCAVCGTGGEAHTGNRQRRRRRRRADEDEG